MVALRNSFLSVALASILLVGLAPPSKGNARLDFGNQKNLFIKPHIVGGNNTSIDKVPFQISIEVFRMHICGGVIISDTWALTAAHCLFPGLTGPTWAKRIRVGASRQIPFIGWEGSIHQIDFSNYDPKFTIEKLDYDIGVIRVSKRFEFSPRIRPVALPTDSEAGFIDYKQTAVASGWGRAHKNDWFATLDLKSVVIPLISRDECQRRLKNATHPSGLKPSVTDRMICAGGDGKGGVCGGDSGGPLVHKGYVIGLASWTFECNHPTYPGVFTNLLNKEIRAFIRIHSNI